MNLNTQKIEVPAIKAMKLFLFLFLFFGILLWGAVSIFYKVQFNSMLNSLAAQEVHTIGLQKIELENSLFGAFSDLLFLSGQNELHKYLNTRDKKDISAIEKEYRNFALRKKKYDNIRYLDSVGQEIVRINYNSGHPYPVVQDDLQNKIKRYYFSDVFILKQGEIFISPLDLNIENGKIEQPFKPMLRLGTPVFNSQGDKCGIVLINYLAQALFDDIKKSSKISPGSPMLLNRKGYWLFHEEEPEKEWGFMITGRKNCNFASAYPEEWQAMLKQKTGHLHTQKGLFTFATVYPLQKGVKSSAGAHGVYDPSTQELDSSQYFWIVVSHITPESLERYVTPLQFRVFWLGTGLFVFIVLGAWFLALAVIKRRIYQSRLVSMALYDTLTSLPNRKYFFDRLEEGLSHAQRYGHKLGLLYLDLDGFKAVNDVFGHEAGDELLVKVSKRLRAVVRKTDMVARLGGDEFAIILSQVSGEAGVQTVGEKLIKEINRPLDLRCGNVSVGVSIGGTVYPGTAHSPEELVKFADQAMYISKSKGKNMYTLSDGRQE